ncbi:MAG: OmpA family protein [Methylococcales bacterium]|nr:OmpA family protein [Methylococcales bacterium]
MTEQNDAKIKEEELPFNYRIEQKSYDVLKNLLTSEEDHRLEALEFYFKTPKALAKKIALALPKAIRQADNESLRDSLDEALHDTVQTCLIESVHREPELYVDALYPVILPMIKKSIAEAFKEVMQSLNSAIEQGLSINRFSWHFQAWRTGMPYREIVLRNTLAYRVEQAFLIHRETGLLLRHVSNEGIDEIRDSDAVSAMLTAIQDFTQDSFSVNQTEKLDTVEIGDYTVYLDRGAYAMLACVIQGIPPYSLRDHFETILGNIHQQHIRLLTKFEGDSEPLEVIDADLQKCLLSEQKQGDEKSSVSGRYILIPLLLIFIVIGYWSYDNWKFEQRRENYLQLLQKQHGIIVTYNALQNGELLIKGLYDPLIIHPDKLLEKSSLQTDEVTTDWQAYHSLAPAIVEQRLKQTLHAPPLVNVHLDDTLLTLTGVADKTWINNLTTITPVLSGVTAIDYQQLQNYPYFITQQLKVPETVNVFFNQGALKLEGISSIAWRNTLEENIAKLSFITDYNVDKLDIIEEKQLKMLTEKLENQAIYFTDGAKLTEKQSKDLLNSVNLIIEMGSLSNQLDQTMYLVITGHTDGLNSTKYNTALGQKRAEKIINYLKQHSISIEMIIASELSQSRRGNKLQRKVDFAVIFTQEKQTKK